MFLSRKTHNDIVSLLQNQHDLTLEILSDELNRGREANERTHREYLNLLEAHTALTEAMRAQVSTIDRLQNELAEARKVGAPQFSPVPLYMTEEEEEAEWANTGERADREVLREILLASGMNPDVEIEEV